MTEHDFYEKKAVAKALANEVYKPSELIHEVRNFIQSQVERLESERMLCLTSFSYEVEGSDIAVKSSFFNKDGRQIFDSEHRPKLRVSFGWGFLGMEALARKKLFETLGKQAFIEKHWESFAVRLMERDAFERARQNAPMPEGLAVRIEAARIEAETLPAQNSQRSARAL